MKRFTETEKWRDPWFRKLSAGAKLAFLYIIDNCDNAGVWTADKELADFSIGMEIPWVKVLEAFGERVSVLPSGDWLIVRFVEFQFGKLSKDCKPHLQVMRLIEKHRVSKGYPKGFRTLEEKDKEKEKEPEGSAEGDFSSVPSSDFPESLRDIAFGARWQEWEMHCRDRGRALTSVSRQAQLSDCEKQGRNNAMKALIFSITNNRDYIGWDWMKDSDARRNGTTKPKPRASV
jgi:hypothetical protein